MDQVPLHLIVVAAGNSRRYGGGDKLLADLNGAPVFVHALRRLTPAVTGTCVLVVPQGKSRIFQEAAFPFVRDLKLIWCEGGDTRTVSVKKGIAALQGSPGIAAVHDAARPLANVILLKRLYDVALASGAALPGKAVSDTLWRSDGETISSSVDRKELFAVETPQLFDLELWEKAQKQFPDADLTDDAGLLRMAGFPVALLINPEPNIKLTTPSDLTVLRALI